MLGRVGGERNLANDNKYRVFFSEVLPKGFFSIFLYLMIARTKLLDINTNCSTSQIINANLTYCKYQQGMMGTVLHWTKLHYIKLKIRKFNYSKSSKIKSLELDYFIVLFHPFIYSDESKSVNHIIICYLCL